MAVVFLPSSASCVDVFAFNSSIFISRRRVEMANSARSRSLSARISEIDIGVDASNRFMVNRTARLCTSGMNNRPSKVATKNPIPKYMTDSITAHLSPYNTRYIADHSTVQMIHAISSSGKLEYPHSYPQHSPNWGSDRKSGKLQSRKVTPGRAAWQQILHGTCR